MAVASTSKKGVKATMPFKMPKPAQPQAVKRSRDEMDDDEQDDDDSEAEAEEEETGSSTIDGDEVLDESESDEDSSEEEDGSAEEEEDEDDEAIRELGQKPKPAKKTKNVSLKPTTADDFASQLQHLLSLPATSAVPRPKVAAPSDRQLKLERQARRLVRDTKAAKLARGHVRDVIGGWGPRPALPFSQWDNAAARRFAHAQTNGASEGGAVSGGTEAAAVAETSAEREKRLRKLAQRGVVRLFNAIAAAQGVAQEEKTVERSPKKQKRTSAAGEDGETAEEPKTLRRPNVLGGKGRDQAIANLSKASFLDLIRAGTK